VEQLRVVDLQQHAGYLPRQAGMHVLDEREEALTWCGERERERQSSSVLVRDGGRRHDNVEMEMGRGGVARLEGHVEVEGLPSICFCSWGGAAASMEAVSGSWPCTWTAGCSDGRDRTSSETPDTNNNPNKGLLSSNKNALSTYLCSNILSWMFCR